MIRVLAVAVLVGCATYSPVRAQGQHAMPPHTNTAITVRGLVGVHAAGGHYLGVIAVDSTRLRSAIQGAVEQAATLGGTHISLRSAEQTTGGRATHAMIGNQATPEQAPRFVEDEHTSDATVVFDVFRVEADHWPMLDPQLRPLPR